MALEVRDISVGDAELERGIMRDTGACPQRADRR